MTVEIIPIKNEDRAENFSISASLDGIKYKFIFKHNAREDRWYFDFIALDGTVLRAGIKCVVNYALLFYWAAAEKPGGNISIVNTGANPTDPGFTELGLESLLSYLPEVDYLALG